MDKISICIPTYNRTDLLFKSFANVIADPRVGQIVISDDASTDETYNYIKREARRSQLYSKKIDLFRNHKNKDCYLNKKQAISRAIHEYVILLDSDNQIDKSYLDAIYDNVWYEDSILQPSFARPHFDFRKYSSLRVTSRNVRGYLWDSNFTTMLNAANYFVNRDKYLNCFDASVDPVTSDSIFMAYNWLKSGNSIYVTPHLEYDHLVHEGSHYKNNVKRTPAGFHQSIINKLKALR